MHKILMQCGGRLFTVTLNDNDCARQFLSLLPLTLKLEDFAKKEKIGWLPHKLSVSGASEGYQPRAGDIAYYAPWGNLAIFYQNADFAQGLVKIGQFDNHADITQITHCEIKVITK